MALHLSSWNEKVCHAAARVSLRNQGGIIPPEAKRENRAHIPKKNKDAGKTSEASVEAHSNPGFIFLPSSR